MIERGGCNRGMGIPARISSTCDRRNQQPGTDARGARTNAKERMSVLDRSVAGDFAVVEADDPIGVQRDVRLVGYENDRVALFI